MSADSFKRRDFLKLLGWSSLLCAVPQGCRPAVDPTIPVAMVKHADTGYAVFRAVELAGGFGFISPGDSVLIKIALNSPSPFPATTSPDMVRQVVSLLKAAGAGDIIVADKSPSWQDTEACLAQTGIQAAAVEAGARTVVFQDDDMVPVQPAGAVHWPGGFHVPALFSQVHHVIVLPTLRTHQMAGFTMGMKLFVGALPQEDRYAMHASPWFHQAIAEIALCTDRVRMSVLDARQGFNRGGPDSGNLIQPGMIIASPDLAAADAAGLALLRASGALVTGVWNNPVIRRGAEVLSPNLSGAAIKLAAEGVEGLERIKAQLRCS